MTADDKITAINLLADDFYEIVLLALQITFFLKSWCPRKGDSFCQTQKDGLFANKCFKNND